MIKKKFDHRFGMISSLVAKHDIQAGEEVVLLYLLWSQYCFMFSVITKRKNVFAAKVTVNYRLPLHLAPSWFRDCWTRWRQDLGRKSSVVQQQESDRKSGRKKNEGQETNDEEEKQGNNDEFHSMELLEERFEEAEEEKERWK